jgi:hypothetical protein
MPLLRLDAFREMRPILDLKMLLRSSAQKGAGSGANQTVCSTVSVEKAMIGAHEQKAFSDKAFGDRRIG